MNAKYYILLLVSLPAYLIALMLAAVLRLLNVKFCIVKVRRDRIGHYLGDLFFSLLQKSNDKDNGSFKVIRIYYSEHVSVNKFVDKLFRRSNIVVNPFKYISRVESFLFGKLHILREESLSESKLWWDYDCEIDPANLGLLFSNQEESYGFEFLRSRGWKDGQPIAAMIIRDSSYLNSVYPDSDWAYHDFRDSDISLYRKSVEFLIEEGFFVVRMGSVVKDPLVLSNDHLNSFLDYPFDPCKSEMLDIWIFKICNIALSTGTGIDEVVRKRRSPLLLVNYTPFNHVLPWMNVRMAPKKIVSKKSKKLIEYQRYFSATYLKESDYSSNDLRVECLNEEQILDSVKDFLNSYYAKFSTLEDERMASAFWKLFESHIPDDEPFSYPSSVTNEARSCLTKSWLKLHGISPI